MSKEELIMALASLVAGTFTIGIIALSVAKVMIARRHKSVAESDTAQIEARLERIEQAIDAMATEVERVSEGQRFTSRLLSERTADRT